MGEDEIVRLTEAIRLYRKEFHRLQNISIGNSDRYFVNQAKERSEVFFFSSTHAVPVFKVKNRWMVKVTDLKANFAAGQAENDEMLRNDLDYSKRILRGKGLFATKWGYYNVNENFHFVSYDYERLRMRSDGFWRCNKCWKAAESSEEHRAICAACGTFL